MSRPAHRAAPVFGAAPPSGATSRPAPPRTEAGAGREVAVKYTETSRIHFHGAVTQRRYEFSSADRIKMVDARDAAVLLGSRFFVRA